MMFQKFLWKGKMMSNKVIVTLNQELIIEVVRIIMDEDKEESLNFLKKYIEPEIKKLEYGHCRPFFEWKTSPPEIYKKLIERKEDK